jgi:hypothetical protein
MRDITWTEDLSPDEAQAAIDALNAHKGLLTVREAVEVRKLKLALASEGRRTVAMGFCVGAALQ